MKQMRNLLYVKGVTVLTFSYLNRILQVFSSSGRFLQVFRFSGRFLLSCMSFFDKNGWVFFERLFLTLALYLVQF
jgi:hypothetical protein